MVGCDIFIIIIIVCVLFDVLFLFYYYYYYYYYCCYCYCYYYSSIISTVHLLYTFVNIFYFSLVRVSQYVRPNSVCRISLDALLFKFLQQTINVLQIFYISNFTLLICYSRPLSERIGLCQIYSYIYLFIMCIFFALSHIQKSKVKKQTHTHTCIHNGHNFPGTSS